LFRQLAPNALPLALAKAGKSMPAKIAMMAITTSNSISVNPFEYGYFVFILKKAVKERYSHDQAWQALFPPLGQAPET
jgi:hypothetical protein